MVAYMFDVRKCPDCERELPPGTTKFDKKHNVLCSYCNGVVLSATLANERHYEPPKVVPPVHTTRYEHD